MEASTENSISSDSKLFDSSNCIIASSSSRYSALCVRRNLSLPTDEQQMPESSDPRLDWSKLGEELAAVMPTPLPIPADTTPTRDSVLRAASTGLHEAESSGQTIGSALPQMPLNLITNDRVN